MSTSSKCNLYYIDNEFMNNCRGEVVANVHSYIGNAYLEMGEYEKAQENHQKDYDFAKAKYAVTSVYLVSLLLTFANFFKHNFHFIIASFPFHSKNDDALSRSLDNLGRVYARTGRFQDAIDVYVLILSSKKEKKHLIH